MEIRLAVPVAAAALLLSASAGAAAPTYRVGAPKHDAYNAWFFTSPDASKVTEVVDYSFADLSDTRPIYSGVFYQIAPGGEMTVDRDGARYVGIQWSRLLPGQSVVYTTPGDNYTYDRPSGPIHLTAYFSNSGPASWVTFINHSDQMFAVAMIPEPSTYVLLALGLAAVGVVGRRRVHEG